MTRTIQFSFLVFCKVSILYCLFKFIECNVIWVYFSNKKYWVLLIFIHIFFNIILLPLIKELTFLFLFLSHFIYLLVNIEHVKSKLKWNLLFTSLILARWFYVLFTEICLRPYRHLDGGSGKFDPHICLNRKGWT